MIFFIWIQTQSNLTEIRSYFYLHGQSNINLMKTLWLSEALLRPRPDIFESATFPFRVRLPSTRIRRIRPAYISATFWLRSPEWKCLALLSTWNRMDAKSGYFFFFFFFFIWWRNKIEPTSLSWILYLRWQPRRIRGDLGTRVNPDTCRTRTGRATHSIWIRIRVDVEIFESGKKKLRIRKYPGTCERGLSFLK